MKNKITFFDNLSSYQWHFHNVIVGTMMAMVLEVSIYSVYRSPATALGSSETDVMVLEVLLLSLSLLVHRSLIMSRFLCEIVSQCLRSISIIMILTGLQVPHHVLVVLLR